jgi:hypothetical protein
MSNTSEISMDRGEDTGAARQAATQPLSLLDVAGVDTAGGKQSTALAATRTETAADKVGNLKITGADKAESPGKKHTDRIKLDVADRTERREAGLKVAQVMREKLGLSQTASVDEVDATLLDHVSRQFKEGLGLKASDSDEKLGRAMLDRDYKIHASAEPVQ